MHAEAGASFTEVNGMEVVAQYGKFGAEHRALAEGAGILDLSFRSRLAVSGSDRQRFLNGQVTNHVAALKPGEGCYAALVTAKGKMESDLNIWCFPDRFLLDFEPGLNMRVGERLQKYIIADDVEIGSLAESHALFSVQGPLSVSLVRELRLALEVPDQPGTFRTSPEEGLGEVHLANLPRFGTAGFDLYVPRAGAEALFLRLQRACQKIPHGSLCGWEASECARIEAGIPRYGADMDDTNFPAEAGITERAVSYSKGCYIGQEVIARIRTYGQVTRHLKGFLLADTMTTLPAKGDPLMLEGKIVGAVTSATHSPRLKKNIGLGYLRREVTVSEGLKVKVGGEEMPVEVAQLPFLRGD